MTITQLCKIFEYISRKPLASFLATDVNQDNQLNTNEVKTLLWLIEGEEPTEKRVGRDIAMIDADDSGTIDKLEWIKYLGSSGSNVREWMI